MSGAFSHLPYRPNVGIALFNRKGELFLGKRADVPGSVWQCPQGGIDDGEDPRQAAWREMEEEIGTRKAVLLGERRDWLSYDLPPELLGRALGGNYRGQRQKWFAFGFTGAAGDIDLTAQTPPEFSDWAWVPPENVLKTYDLAFKRPLYETLLPDLVALFQSAPKDWI